MQPLSSAQIEDYLSPPEFAGIRDVLEHDPTLQAMVQIPFLLNTVGYTYGGLSTQAIVLSASNDPATDRRNHLFENYIERRFRENPDNPYTLKQVRHYLTYLAGQMVKHSETVFLIERLQPDWLPSRRAQLTYTWGMWLLLALIIGIIPITMLLTGFLIPIQIVPLADRYDYSLPTQIFLVGLLYPATYLIGFAVTYGLTKTWWGKLGAGSMLLAALYIAFRILPGYESSLNEIFFPFLGLLSCGVIHALLSVLTYEFVYRSSERDRIRLIERLHLSWRKMLRGACEGLILALWLSLITAIGLLLLRGSDYMSQSSVQGSFLSLLYLLVVFGVPFFAILRGLSPVEISMKAYPNQGIYQSGQNALLTGATAMIFVMTLFTIIAVIFQALFVESKPELANIEEGFENIVAISSTYWGTTLAVSLNFMMLFGGMTLLQHLVLRLWLWRRGSIPRNYAAFLDYAADRMLLRKVGGGYIFIHKYLLEYFGS